MEVAPKAGASDPEATILRLANGVRVVAIALPHLQSVTSACSCAPAAPRGRRLNGISHFVEHMAFKGTHDAQLPQINLDAERLGADVNAHTDKDHTAYHMRGLAADAARFVRMLGDIVRNSSFPEAELERERQVHPAGAASRTRKTAVHRRQAVRRLSFGSHPIAPAGDRHRAATISRFGRDDLLDYVEQPYTGANVVVGVVGRFDSTRSSPRPRRPSAAMRAGGAETSSRRRRIVGGVASTRAGYSQTHVVLGFPIASLRADDQPAASPPRSSARA